MPSPGPWPSHNVHLDPRTTDELTMPPVRREEIHDLIRTECKEALEKCFESTGVKGWNDGICDNIFSSTHYLQLLLIQKLARVREGAEAEEDCICLLACLVYAWNSNSQFSERYAAKSFEIAVVTELRPQLSEGIVDMVRFLPFLWLCSPGRAPCSARRADGCHARVLSRSSSPETRLRDWPHGAV